VLLLVLTLADTSLFAADLSISSIQGNGGITWSNIVNMSSLTDVVIVGPSSINYHRVGCYSVEWASALTDSWKAGWQGLDGIVPRGTNMTAGVPMFFRLKYTAADNMLWPAISGRKLRFEETAQGITSYSVWQYVNSFVSPSSSNTYAVVERTWENSDLKAYYVTRNAGSELHIVDNKSGREGVAFKTGPEEQPWTYYSNGSEVTTVILAITNRPSITGMPAPNSAAICHKRQTASGSLWYEWIVPGLGLVAMWDKDGSSERLIEVIDP